MANYLNSIKPFSLFESEQAKPYFVDKSFMITELLSLIQSGSSYVCITRPRRFGKTLMASMIAAYLEKNRDSADVFNCLKISESESYRKHLNAHDVIYIAFNELPRRCTTYEQYISRIERRLVEDLREAYPDSKFGDDEAVWDYLFHRDFVTDKDKEAYVEFLSNLLKGQPYVSLAYMTGILPIAKYSSGSELNMFLEYTMASEEVYSDYFGFTETEVDDIYNRFLRVKKEPKVKREGLRIWYDGYHTKSGERVYNPRSVVASLTNNNLDSYWTNSGPYEHLLKPRQENMPLLP